MPTFEDFLKTRQDLNSSFKIRNIISFILFSALSYSLFQLVYSSTKHPLIILFSIMVCITLTLGFSILSMKLRAVTMTRENNKSLNEYIMQAIREARLHGNYSVLNSLLDSKYSSYVILNMAKFPNSAFDFTQLAKWTRLEESISYFRKNNLTESDLMDMYKMVDYLKAVAPNFIEGVSPGKED